MEKKTFYAPRPDGFRVSFHHGPSIHGVGQCAYPTLEVWKIIKESRPTTMGLLITRCEEEIPAILEAFDDKVQAKQDAQQEAAGKLAVLSYARLLVKISDSRSWIAKEVVFFLHRDTCQDVSSEIATGMILTHLYEKRVGPDRDWSADVVCVSAEPPPPLWLSMLRRVLTDKDLDGPAWETGETCGVQKRSFAPADLETTISTAIDAAMAQRTLRRLTVVVIFCKDTEDIINKALKGRLASAWTTNMVSKQWTLDTEATDEFKNHCLELKVVQANQRERVSLPKCANVAAVVCWGEIEENQLDMATIQEVQKRRWKSHQELDEQLLMLSNGTRAHSAELGETIVYVPSGQLYGRPTRASLHDDPYGFVLHMVGHWPNLHPICWPVPHPPSPRAIDTIVRRLDVMGCLRFPPPDRTPERPISEGAGSLLGQSPTPLVLSNIGHWVFSSMALQGLSFRAAYLAALLEDDDTAAVKHTVLRMAALLDVPPMGLLSITPFMEDDDEVDWIESLEGDIPNVVRGHHEDGYLWMALAIVIHFEEHRPKLAGMLHHPLTLLRPEGKLLALPSVVNTVLERVEKLDFYWQHNDATREQYRRTELQEYEVNRIQELLFRASFFRSLWVSPGAVVAGVSPTKVVDVACGQSLLSSICQEVDILSNWETLFVGQGDNRVALVIYLRLVEIEHGTTAPLGLTLLKAGIWKLVQERMDVDLFETIRRARRVRQA